jgi:hypothetical protein
MELIACMAEREQCDGKLLVQLALCLLLHSVVASEEQ